MIEQPHRRFWQIHLSTAVVLMFTAAALMYGNLVERFTWTGALVKGWPIPYAHCTLSEARIMTPSGEREPQEVIKRAPDKFLMSPDGRLLRRGEWGPYGYVERTHGPPVGLLILPINFAAATAILVCVLVGMEVLCRFRESRR